MIPETFQKLIKAFRMFPGVGQRTAQRYALYLLDQDKQRGSLLCNALENALHALEHCQICGILKDGAQACLLCTDPKRTSQLLVVPSLFDVLHFEDLGCFQGRYHVLGGQLSPLEGIGPQELRLNNLVDRVQQEHISEVILALSPTLEGEATSFYLARMLHAHNIRISRLASGIPVGEHLVHLDAQTLSLSIQQRQQYALPNED